MTYLFHSFHSRQTMMGLAAELVSWNVDSRQQLQYAQQQHSFLECGAGAQEKQEQDLFIIISM